jgi:peptidoglycan pentaglycine glycine transferase (the first glycine)
MVKTARALMPADRAAWEALAEKVGSFMQSWAWADFKELEGHTVLRIGLWDGDVLTGGAMVYGCLSPLEGQLWVVPGGPLVDWRSPEEWDCLLAAIRRAPEARQAVILRIEPSLDEAPSFLSGTLRSPSDLFPDQTLEIELGSEDAMLQRAPGGAAGCGGFIFAGPGGRS